MFPDRSVVIGQKLVENTTIQMRQFESFSNTVETNTLLSGKCNFLLIFSMFECLFPPWKNDVTEDFFFSSGRSVSEGSLYPRGSSVCIILNKILEKSPKEDESGRTPLHYACENGHVDVVKNI